MKRLLSGNEAMAWGAWEAGVVFAAGYPGTPATEILENIARRKEVDAQWAANEKVAFEEVMGAAIGGVRALVAVKHVGLNVAADSFMVFPYAGTNAGFVVISSDDPGAYSSQNEQDNRYFAKFGKVPLLEPSDAQECHDLIVKAFDISEQFKTPVMLRTTMRINHTKCLVEVGERQEREKKQYHRDPTKWSVPNYCRSLRPILEEKQHELAAYSESFEGNFVELNSDEVGIITSGICYCYAKEAMPDASFFKLGMTYPLPKQKIIDFCERFEKVYIVEEGEPFLEEQIRAFGVTNVVGKELFTNVLDLSPDLVAKGLLGTEVKGDFSKEIGILTRPPQLCVGCSHRGVFFTLRKLDVLATGDIGCYSLGSQPPFSAQHTIFCMGAGIANAFGFEKAGTKDVVSLIGDSTFIHAGIPPLIDMVYNKSKGTVIILDNDTTGMTGHQEHPSSGRTLKGEEAKELNIEQLCKVIGVEYVKQVDPYNLDETEKTIREAMAFPGAAVVIAKRPCLLMRGERNKKRIPYVVNDECVGCGVCYQIDCPALSEGPDGLAVIDAISCAGCGMCASLCPTRAIVLSASDRGLKGC